MEMIALALVACLCVVFLTVALVTCVYERHERKRRNARQAAAVKGLTQGTNQDISALYGALLYGSSGPSDDKRPESSCGGSASCGGGASCGGDFRAVPAAELEPPLEFVGCIPVDGGTIRVGDRGYLALDGTADLCFEARTGDGTFEVLTRTDPNGIVQEIRIRRHDPESRAHGSTSNRVEPESTP